MFVGIARLARAGDILEEKARVDYRTLPSRSLLNRCSGGRMPFVWTINPYRGCEFACRYCYARYTHEFMELRDPADFETKIFAKTWDAALFRTELRRVRSGEAIALGTATDPYQPAERRFHLTRGILEVFSRERGLGLFLTTKSDLVVRDAELLATIAKRNDLWVNLTVTTMDQDLARRLEPLAPRPELRIAAIRALSAAGVQVRVFASPVMPGLNDSRDSLTRVAKAGTDAGAMAFAVAPLFLKPCAQQVFFPFLEEQFPALGERYRNLYAKSAFLGPGHRERLVTLVRQIRLQVGLPERDFEYVPPGEDQMRLFGDGPIRSS